MCIGIDVESVLQSRWITARPACQPRHVVPSVVITQPALLIALHSRVPISLRWRLDVALDRVIRARAVRVVLLVRHEVARGVDLETRGSEVIAVLIAEE